MAVSRGKERAHPPGAEGNPRVGHLAKIARLYHVEDLGERQIAERLNVSVASVSRALSRAKELGIVTVTVSESPASSHAELEIEMERRFGLRECLLVPGFEGAESTYRALAGEMVSLLPRLLKPGSTLGLSWGETLKAIGENLAAIPTVRADVVPIIGAMGRIETGVYPNSIARSFAEKLGGNAYLINTPAIVDSPEIRASVMSDSNFAPVRRLWRRLTTIVLGVSGLGPDTSVSRGGIFSKTELSRMRACGGVCATNFVILDEAGKPVATDFSDRLVNLTLPEMRNVPNVVIVGAGQNKVAALRAVLRAGFVHVLMSDVPSARALLSGGSEED